MKLNSVDRFIIALAKTIDYFSLEYDLTYAEVIGAIELIKSDLINEAGSE
jgi:hypothetical protein